MTGVVGAFLRTAVVGPAHSDPRPNAPTLSPAIFSYFDLQVERVISAPPAVREGGMITLAVHGQPGQTTFGQMLMPQRGDKRLYVLRVQPDGASYGTRTGIFNIDGPTVSSADMSKPPVIGFTNQTAPAAFMQALKTARERIALPNSPR
ncbi:MAG: hypothetical protein FJ035_04930 [Chloroflexi bacterium]|nr:hypothetical protein [Chloroflexota bacterium]